MFLNFLVMILDLCVSCEYLVLCLLMSSEYWVCLVLVLVVEIFNFSLSICWWNSWCRIKGWIFSLSWILGVWNYSLFFHSKFSLMFFFLFTWMTCRWKIALSLSGFSSNFLQVSSRSLYMEFRVKSSTLLNVKLITNYNHFVRKIRNVNPVSNLVLPDTQH